MKIKKKIVIPVVAVAAAGLVTVGAVRSAGAGPVIPIVDTYPVESGDLMNTIDVTGMVESGSTVNVYTTLTYPITEVAVEIGDTVVEGDVLCRLDTTALEATIAQSQAALGSAQAIADWNIAVAEKELETTRFNTEEDYNTQLLQAKDAVKTAKKSLEQARNDLLASQHTANSARKDLVDLREDKKQSTDFTTGGDWVSYDDVLDDLRQKSIQADINMEGAQLRVEAAELALANAEATLRAIEQQVQQEEHSTEDQVTSARLSANFNEQYIALEKLRGDLADATITAPISGTVTAVYAEEGAAGAGILFVLEDPDHLKVITKIKEYDIGSVDTGMPATVRADGAGSDQFEGVLSKIAPTSLKDATTGKTIDSTSTEFEAEVLVTSPSSLRIGMNARVSIITEQKAGVISVPIEAIAFDENGEESVFVYVEQEDGTGIAQQVPVTVGMETDFSYEVTGDGLQDGDEVILSPAELVDGMQVSKMDQSFAPAMMA